MKVHLLHNLYGDPKYDSVVENLVSEYKKLARDTGDKLDLAEYYPELFN